MFTVPYSHKRLQRNYLENSLKVKTLYGGYSPIYRYIPYKKDSNFSGIFKKSGIFSFKKSLDNADGCSHETTYKAIL